MATFFFHFGLIKFEKNSFHDTTYALKDEIYGISVPIDLLKQNISKINIFLNYFRKRE